MKKKKWIGSLLNFLLPGIGYVYSGNIKKAIRTYFLFWIVVLSLRFIAYSFTLFLVSLSVIVIYYLYLIIDGYRHVKEDETEPRVGDKWYVYMLIFVIHAALLISFQRGILFRFTPINFVRVPTPAMDPSLIPGDVLAFKKTKSLARNDVTIFWFPDDIKTMYVKRCIGLPGDSLQVKSSTVLINGTQLPDMELKYKHLVTTKGSAINSRILDKYGIGENDYYQLSSDVYEFFLTKKQAEELRGLTFLAEVKLAISNEEETESMIYPRSGNFRWNTDFYGPVYIPKKGDKIQLTDINTDLYLKCIEFENEFVERDSAGLRVDGQLITEYQFKDNYFFMMGDSRHNSLDSRFWGFLPQELVIGKAMYLYWSRTSDRIGKEVI